MLRTSVFSGCIPLHMVFLVLFSLAGCGDTPPDEVSPKSALTANRKAVDIAVDGSTDAIGPAREALLKNLKTRLNSIDEKITLLANKKSDLTEEARLERNKKVEEFRIRRDAARRRLKALNEASELGWSDVRDGAEAAWLDLEKDVDAAMAE
jgi:predicted small lipoprotein YifL